MKSKIAELIAHNYDWPRGMKYAALANISDTSNRIMFFEHAPIKKLLNGRCTWYYKHCMSRHEIGPVIPNTDIDVHFCYITREDYARASIKVGKWIVNQKTSAEPPVPVGTLVDVIFTDQTVIFGISAGTSQSDTNHVNGDVKNGFNAKHWGLCLNSISHYRVHKMKETQENQEQNQIEIKPEEQKVSEMNYEEKMAEIQKLGEQAVAAKLRSENEANEARSFIRQRDKKIKELSDAMSKFGIKASLVK